MKIKLLILLMVILLPSVCAEFNKTIVSDLTCYGDFKVKMYDTECYIPNCEYSDSVYTCKCTPNMNVLVYTSNYTKCHMTVQYYVDSDFKRVYPFTAEWTEPEEEQPIFDFSQFKTSVGDIILISLIIIGAIGVLVFIIIMGVRYIKKELEDDELRNQ